MNTLYHIKFNQIIDLTAYLNADGHLNLAEIMFEIDAAQIKLYKLNHNKKSQIYTTNQQVLAAPGRSINYATIQPAQPIKTWNPKKKKKK